jgi:hypothetical protein
MRRRWLVAALFVVLLLAGAAWLRWLAQAPQGTDTQQILAQIQRGQHAAEERNAGALMRVVSPDYRDENGARQVLAYEARQQLRDAQRLEVTIPLNDLHIQVAPSGREATSTGRIEVRITDRQGGAPRTLSLSPTLRWRKERVRRYLLFPVEEWHVVRAEGFESGE